jgi:hypothetical protein
MLFKPAKKFGESLKLSNFPQRLIPDCRKLPAVRACCWLEEISLNYSEFNTSNLSPMQKLSNPS